MAIELDNIELTYNAQFYALNKSLSNNLISKVFKRIKNEKKPSPTNVPINKNIRNNIRRKDVYVSALVYSTEKSPSFIKNASGYREKKYSYIVLIEMNNMLVVSKLNAPDIGKYFPKHVKYLAHEEINTVFSNDEPVFNKLNTSSTSLVDIGVRTANYEGNDLKSALNSYGVQQSIANSYNVKTKNSEFDDNSVNPNTRRIKTKGKRTDIRSFIEWAEKIIVKMNQTKKSTFLDSFAAPIDYEQIKKNKLLPVGVLLKTESLEDKIYNGDGNYELKYKKSDKKYLAIKHSRFRKVINEAKYSFIISNNQFELNKLTIEVKALDNKLKLKSDDFRKIYLFNVNSKRPQNIESYFNSKGDFSIIFQDPKYIYNKHQLYFDKGILNNIESLLQIVEPKDYLEDVINEKLYSDNEKKKIDKTITCFDEKTLFNMVEKKVYDEGHLICDDLGDEWADHIHCKIHDTSPEILFYISKHGETSTKASSLHDVLGQVSKNIGNIKFDKEKFEDKIKTWNNNWSGTKINRLRSDEKDWNKVLDDVEKLIVNPKTVRTLCVVTTLLSYKQLKQELIDFRDGKNKQKHLSQLIWFLASYVNACKINEIKPRILCKP